MPDFHTSALTRRQFLRAAGGTTFLALVPTGRGLFAATQANRGVPLFTALPYVQPGAASHLVPDEESVVLAWQTAPTEAVFEVSYGPTPRYGRGAAIQRSRRWSGDAEDGEWRHNYQVKFDGLPLGALQYYRVRCNGTVIADGYFTTRQPRGRHTHFVAFGDNSYGDISDRAIAYRAYAARPQFVMNTGDNVYDDGLDNEYARYFFPVYNAELAGSRTGAPLLRAVPFYTVIANHDVHAKDAAKSPVADFSKNPDSLAFYTAMHLPLNGPASPAHPSPAVGDEPRLAEFRDAAGPRFPRMANYSFDYGDAHFLCLDSNLYVDPTDAALQSWVRQDLADSDAPWKFAVYHHPAFNVGDEHYAEQHMRALSPLLEAGGVQAVFSGHEHSYQRTRPIRFTPGDLSEARRLHVKDRLVPGEIRLDRRYDGLWNTKPDGILHITTGAGGKHLYDADHNHNPAHWLHPQDNNLDYCVRFVSDRHSLTVLDLDSRTLTVQQIDADGDVIDRFVVTRG